MRTDHGVLHLGCFAKYAAAFFRKAFSSSSRATSRLTSLEGRQYRRTTATYALHLGELAPEEPVFHFTRQTDVEAEAGRLAGLYATVGKAYAQSIASYEQLLPLLQGRVPMLGAYPERVASCLYLMDRKDEARAFVEAFLEDHRNYFEGFAVPFLERLTH